MSSPANRTERFDTVILGAGAAGMYCAPFAAAQGGRVLVVDHAKAPGEKIRISGGGRCNFTNLHTVPDNFICENPHFAKSALKRHTPYDFIGRVDGAGIAWHEKTLGQLFCDDSAKQIIAMLVDEISACGAELRLKTSIYAVRKTDSGFEVDLDQEGRRYTVRCTSLVVATGGKSIPKMGATGFGYKLAEQFGLQLVETRPALVPLTFSPDFLETTSPLAGVAVEAVVEANGASFREGLLFTHRGLSGPSILQASSYWHEGNAVRVNFDPDGQLPTSLRAMRATAGKRSFANALCEHLPKRAAEFLSQQTGANDNLNLADMTDTDLTARCKALSNWTIKPAGTEGYRTAEVTLGGVDTDQLSSRTMATKTVPGLYFIGEVVDVTGWLGGYNFQWAWASAHAAGTAIAEGPR
ncbi:MAG: NAD(P)/FAD-dependent oxidoreductase [Pseudomonadota bacterium]